MYRILHVTRYTDMRALARIVILQYVIFSSLVSLARSNDFHIGGNRCFHGFLSGRCAFCSLSDIDAQLKFRTEAPIRGWNTCVKPKLLTVNRAIFSARRLPVHRHWISPRCSLIEFFLSVFVLLPFAPFFPFLTPDDTRNDSGKGLALDVIEPCSM